MKTQPFSVFLLFADWTFFACQKEQNPANTPAQEDKNYFVPDLKTICMKQTLYTILFLFFLTGLNAQRASTELSLARFYLTAAASGDKVMFAGGGTCGFIPSNVVDIFDVKTGQWEHSQLSAPRHGPAAVSAGQKIYVAGGYNLKTKEESNVVDIYDVPTKNWTTAPLSQARHNIMAVAVGDKILFAGGGVGSPGIPFTAPSDVVDIYDTATKVWTVQKMSLPRDYLGAAVSGSKAYFAGCAFCSVRSSRRQ